MAKAIMVQGTMSNVGKSLIAAGLCRIFREDGYRVAPFKSQNMALNSFITGDGLEMGRAQVVQAEAAGIRPTVDMNPILLKPTTDVGSQVIVRGVPLGNMKARDYFAYKKELVPVVMESYRRLAEEYDIIVIEGAGSPAEINLNHEDIVNMGMAAMADAPVLLVGDIDRGGVFAQLYGTVSLLKEEERARVKGLVINKFRGDKTILDPGVSMLEELCNIPVAGVVPYMQVELEDEDSLSGALEGRAGNAAEAPLDGKPENTAAAPLVDIAVIRFPRIANFTDFNALSAIPCVRVRYVARPSELGAPDLVVLPGTKNTISDLLWLRSSGLEAAVLKLASRRVPIWGICGGFQMLGEEVIDEAGAEGASVHRAAGLGLLPLTTWFEAEKVRTQVTGSLGELDGPLSALSGKCLTGYEIHMGRTAISGGRGPEDTGRLVDYRAEPEICRPMAYLLETQSDSKQVKTDGWNRGNVYGSYVHGIFDDPGIARSLTEALLAKKGLCADLAGTVDFDYAAFKEMQFTALAKGLRESLDMDRIYEIMGIEGGNSREN
ncbi:cobyric acid synthase [Enterocloster lavalensis]|uniref:cobyric acid synthase n=1 Tax=Enterocloster lavalensis TaxID=460384 RepID=UPI0023F580C4|nr:cobyric acid synthase [Enterocloster lavalensis]